MPREERRRVVGGWEVVNYLGWERRRVRDGIGEGGRQGDARGEQ